MPKMQRSRDQWLRENHPALYYTIRALDGDRKALRWLQANTTMLYQLCRAVAGDSAFALALPAADPLERELLIEAMDHEELLDRTQEHHPEVHLLLKAGKGNIAARRQLTRLKPELAPIADLLRQWYRAKPEIERNEEPLRHNTAADVGLLVGEIHLSKKEYTRAVEAFTRAIENEPTPDAYEGRARAFRGLADADVAQAEILRRQT